MSGAPLRRTDLEPIHGQSGVAHLLVIEDHSTTDRLSAYQGIRNAKTDRCEQKLLSLLRKEEVLGALQLSTDFNSVVSKSRRVTKDIGYFNLSRFRITPLPQLNRFGATRKKEGEQDNEVYCPSRFHQLPSTCELSRRE